MGNRADQKAQDALNADCLERASRSGGNGAVVTESQIIRLTQGNEAANRALLAEIERRNSR
jgi:hypothetical protein